MSLSVIFRASKSLKFSQILSKAQILAKFRLQLFDILRQNLKKTKKNSGNFEIIFPNKFFSPIFINSLDSFRVGNKHIEVENQFLPKLQKASIVLQLLYLPSNLYILMSSPVKDIIRRP